LPHPDEDLYPSIATQEATSTALSDEKSPGPATRIASYDNAIAYYDRLRAAFHSGIFQMATLILTRNRFDCKEKYND